MSSGVLVFAYNNEKIDYIKQAKTLAIRVSKYLDLPTTLVTDKPIDKGVFDEVILFDPKITNTKNYNNGATNTKKLKFINDNRVHAFDLSPYDQTLLLDSDYIVADSNFKNCFDSAYNFMIYKDACDLAGHRDYSEFDKISDTGVDFYWATCVYFTKTPTNLIFFNLLKHIQNNYQHYRQVYQIQTPVYRNDHAFSIAIHIMNGFAKSNFANTMPGKLFYTTDKDFVHKIQDNKFWFLLQKEKSLHDYIPCKFEGHSVHIMNKFSLDEILDD